MKKFILLIFITSFCSINPTYIAAQNIAINTTGTAADVSAMLDIVASDKGLLLPRISLSSNTDASTVSGTEANSLIVFNTNGSMTNGNGTGYYYWNSTGSYWMYLAAASNGPGANGQVLTSYGSGNNPQWTNPTATTAGGGSTGCANCITTISTYTATGVTWVQCADGCRNLSEGAGPYTDWRMPTFEEFLYYRTTLDPPGGTWLLTNPVWTATADGSPISNAFVTILESTGVTSATAPTATAKCRCVR